MKALSLGESEAQRLLSRALASAPARAADYVELLLTVTDEQLTRFANSQIHQNVAELNRDARVRVVQGRRQAVVRMNSATADGFAQAIEQALALAALQPEASRPVPLPDPSQPVAEPATSGFSEATASTTPDARGRLVEDACRVAADSRAAAFGFVRSSVQERVFANSQGLLRYHAATSADAKVTVMAGDAAGAALATSVDITDLDLAGLAAEATRRAAPGQPRRVMEPGTYPVVLDVYAVADLIAMLGFMGLGGQAWEEGRSFLQDRIGEQVLAPAVTIWDDATSADSLPKPFDWEGTPTRPVSLIDQGIARGVVHDLDTAGRAGGQSTGHALPPPNPLGPLPTHLFLKAGSMSLAELVAGIERGIFVSHLWYTRPVHPRWTIVTGLTRDGTFWIEGGEIAYPIADLRFTQSYAHALQQVQAIGDTARLVSDNGVHCRVPAISTSTFAFTGQAG